MNLNFEKVNVKTLSHIDASVSDGSVSKEV